MDLLSSSFEELLELENHSSSLSSSLSVKLLISRRYPRSVDVVDAGAINPRGQMNIFKCITSFGRIALEVILIALIHLLTAINGIASFELVMLVGLAIFLVLQDDMAACSTAYTRSSRYRPIWLGEEEALTEIVHDGLNSMREWKGAFQARSWRLPFKQYFVRPRCDQ